MEKCCCLGGEWGGRARLCPCPWGKAKDVNGAHVVVHGLMLLLLLSSSLLLLWFVFIVGVVVVCGHRLLHDLFSISHWTFHYSVLLDLFTRDNPDSLFYWGGGVPR